MIVFTPSNESCDLVITWNSYPVSEFDLVLIRHLGSNSIVVLKVKFLYKF